MPASAASQLLAAPHAQAWDSPKNRFTVFRQAHPMSLTAAMMAAPPTSHPAMKFILRTTTKRLAALLRLARASARANAGTDHRLPARRPTLPPAADLVRIPAYMRRRRLGGRVRVVNRPKLQ
jgi:hypothetical protein